MQQPLVTSGQCSLDSGVTLTILLIQGMGPIYLYGSHTGPRMGHHMGRILIWPRA